MGLNITTEVLDTIELAILVLGLSFTVYFSYRTAKYSKQTYTSTQLERYNLRIAETRRELSKFLEVEMSKNEKIVIEKFEELSVDHEARAALAAYLNAYERLCRDINLKIIDREIALLANRTLILNTYKRFELLITSRRTEGKRTWMQLETLAKQIMQG